MSNRCNKLWNSFVRWFDRAFSSGWVKQVFFLGVLLLLFLAVWILLLSVVLHESLSSGNFIRIIELMLDPGAFVGSENQGDFPVWLQFVIALSGAVLFTAMMITVIGNIVSNRIDDYKKGRVRYNFEDHILILGANSMLVNMLREYLNTNVHGGRKIVILTSRDTEQVHASIASAIPGFEHKLDVTLLNGSRTVETTLAHVQIDEARSIYVLGEDDEIDHDDINLATWGVVRKLCRNVKRDIDCFIVVDRISTYNVFQFGKNITDSHLHLSIINSMENWAQRVLVSREYINGPDGTVIERYPAIDRDGIGISSRKTVRFVIFGMTKMSYAMATTVAHIAHFPNFINSSLRTKICFVAPDIKTEMDFFMGHYANLFELSHARYKSLDEGRKSSAEICKPAAEYGDFLDIEWEFIESSVEKNGMRDLLESWADEDDEYLTISICGNEPDENLAASLYLPEKIYSKEIPVFVYQPLGCEVLRYAHSETGRYRNLYPFGMKDECYDPLFRNRNIKAKKINYLYSLQNCGERYISMCEDEMLDKYWNQQKEYAYHFSNIYAANSVPLKLRSVGINPDALDEMTRLSDSQIEILAEIEHNRWNMERLLMGFKALPSADRNEINDMLSDKCNEERCGRGRKLKKELQSKFIHKDLAPYSELPDESRQYDLAIVRNILEVIR